VRLGVDVERRLDVRQIGELGRHVVVAQHPAQQREVALRAHDAAPEDLALSGLDANAVRRRGEPVRIERRSERCEQRRDLAGCRRAQRGGELVVAPSHRVELLRPPTVEADDGENLCRIVAIVDDRFVQRVPGEDVDPEADALLERCGQVEVASELERRRFPARPGGANHNPAQPNHDYEKQRSPAPDACAEHDASRVGVVVFCAAD